MRNERTEEVRVNLNPLNLILAAKKRQGLRIGYMESASKGFYLNSMETGKGRESLCDLLTDHYHCPSVAQVANFPGFLINEGDRVSYQIMVPHLLATENIEEFERIIQQRFFGIQRFVQQGKNLYNFVKYAEQRRDPIIWYNDIERGIAAWDMGQLTGFARVALEYGYIDKEQAWTYIEQAASICAETLRTPEEIDKSYLLGKAMKSDNIDDWDRMLLTYASLSKYRK
ncbi:MAG: DUF1266 domain-containing protein [Mediterranea sp.]|jgi:hypothetical protein|nr:DUF1266 domain-containing protein [Mediterranea sp.]